MRSVQAVYGATSHLYSSCWLGRICSNLLVFFSLKVSTAGEGLLVNTLMMPVGNDKVMSPVIFTMHLGKAARRMSDVIGSICWLFFSFYLSWKTSISISQSQRWRPQMSLFCPKLKCVPFTVIEEQIKLKIFTFQKLEPENFDIFLKDMTSASYLWHVW